VRRTTVFLLLGLVLASGGFAATAIGSHGGIFRFLTGTTATTTMTSTTPGERRVTLCHKPGSWRHWEHTITVGQAAVWPHLRHGDTLGPCVPPPGQTTQTSTVSTTITSNDNDNDDSTGPGDSGGLAVDDHGQGSGSLSGQQQDSENGHDSGHGHGQGDD
jgi:hypothetical protein